MELVVSKSLKKKKIFGQKHELYGYKDRKIICKEISVFETRFRQ